MSDTPRTDNAIHDEHDPYEAVGTLCHKLELELSAANSQIGLLVSGSKQQERQIEFLKETIQRLVEAGDKAIENSYYPDRLMVWNKAKEGL